MTPPYLYRWTKIINITLNIFHWYRVVYGLASNIETTKLIKIGACRVYPFEAFRNLKYPDNKYFYRYSYQYVFQQG